MTDTSIAAFWKDLRTQRRVVGALIIREVYTRFGRENIGFAWIIVEPLMFALPVLGAWSLIRNHIDRGIPMLDMAWTGYLPLLAFRHITAYMMKFVNANRGLLYHRQVTIFDMFLARGLLETLSNIAAVIVSGSLLLLLRGIDWPADPPMFLLGYFYNIWWALAVGAIVAGLSERYVLVEKIWPTISYLYMAVSGFFFLAEWLPVWVRDFGLTVMPAIHCYEMIRAGEFGHLIHPYYSIPYLSAVLGVLSVLGLALLRDTRRHIVFE